MLRDLDLDFFYLYLCAARSGYFESVWIEITPNHLHIWSMDWVNLLVVPCVSARSIEKIKQHAIPIQ